MTDRLYIAEIQKFLQYKDRRSARRWCRNNGVNIFSDIGSNKQFVLKTEFERAKTISTLYKSPQVLTSTMKFFSQYQQALPKKESNYKPQGQYEKEFLSILQNINRTL